MRCGYCHNPELVLPERYADAIPTDDILTFLATRVGKLEGVTISGGEPTMHEDLPDFIEKVKALGFLIKLDSNGTNPAMLRELFARHLIDYIAMDIKGALRNYPEIVARPVDLDAIVESINLIKVSGVACEFRTTVVKSQISEADFDDIGALVAGAPRFALQKFRPARTLNLQFQDETTYSDEEFEILRLKMEHYVDECVVH